MPPLWVFFNDLLHLAFDIAFFSYAILMLVFVIKTSQRQHIKWLVPSLASSTTSLLFRLIEIGHHLLGTYWTIQNYMSIDVLVDFEDVFGIVSTILLWKVLKSSGFSLSQKTPPIVDEQAATGVWPPAPRS